MAAGPGAVEVEFEDIMPIEFEDMPLVGLIKSIKDFVTLVKKLRRHSSSSGIL